MMKLLIILFFMQSITMLLEVGREIYVKRQSLKMEGLYREMMLCYKGLADYEQLMKDYMKLLDSHEMLQDKYKELTGEYFDEEVIDDQTN